jgi:hypothetical protein
MTSQKKVTSKYQSDSAAVADIAAANDSASNEATTDSSPADNGVDLANVFDTYFRPDANTIVCGALDNEKVASLAQAGVELVINLQPDDELSFDEASADQWRCRLKTA